ncbi:MAG: hypothetical protein ABSE08_14680 [Syntrophobacteraceae bacterium]|jgi:hypothetical protein
MNKVQVFSPAWALLFISGAAVSSLQELKKDNTFDRINRIYRIKEKDNTFDSNCVFQKGAIEH